MTHHTKSKGDLAVVKVIADLTEKGYDIYLPISEHTKSDLIAENGSVYRIQVKHSVDGIVRNVQSWSDKNGHHRSKYNLEDFDYYALYLQQIDKIIYPHISYGGKKIRYTYPCSTGEYFWYEDFFEFTKDAKKRSFSSDFIKIRFGKRNTGIRPQKIHWPSKDELEKLVWQKPTIAIADELGVSDSAIVKRCRKLGVSKPPRGYWAKLKSIAL